MRKILACLLIFILLGCKERYELSQLRVKEVFDGDTIELENGQLVRYIGIDTPELRNKETQQYDPEDFALSALEFNQKLVEGNTVRLELDVTKIDEYNRLLAYCFVGEIFVNQRLLEEGLAVLYTFPPNVKYVDSFREAQKTARLNKRGLWREEMVISSNEAADFIGKRKIVEGRVFATHKGKSAVYLNFGKDWQTDFSVVIFNNNLTSFKKLEIEPEIYYKGKIVRVVGIIKSYNGPEIIINDPELIEVVEELTLQ